MGRVRCARSGLGAGRSGFWWRLGQPTVQRSFVVRGDRSAAETRGAELVAEFGIDAMSTSAVAAVMTVGEVVQGCFDAPHLWNRRR